MVPSFNSLTNWFPLWAPLGDERQVTVPLKIKPSFPIKMGWIPYWNLRPLGKELSRATKGQIEFHQGAPSLVNRMLSEGSISLAPCSSVCLVERPRHQLAYPVGVASTGKVKSVYLGFRHGDGERYRAIIERHAQLSRAMCGWVKEPHHDPRKSARLLSEYAAGLPELGIPTPKLIITPASAASAALTRVLFRLWFGEPAREVKPKTESPWSEEELPIELVIGDEALIRRRQFSKIIDLGEAWNSLTGLPFVYAVWQSTGKTLSPYWGHILKNAAEKAQAKMHVDPSEYLLDMTPTDVVGHQIDLGAYWKHIQYSLGPLHMLGLSVFLSLVRYHNTRAQSSESITQILRCQELAEGARP